MVICLQISATVRFEPSLQRALSLAAAERLCSRVGDRIQPTVNGEQLVQKVLADSSVLIEEKEFLERHLMARSPRQRSTPCFRGRGI